MKLLRLLLLLPLGLTACVTTQPAANQPQEPVPMGTGRVESATHAGH
jgi:hypothetical protein